MIPDKYLPLPAIQALLGCDFGSVVATPDDTDPCKRQATSRVVVHDGPASIELQLCDTHRAVIDEQTNPRT